MRHSKQLWLLGGVALTAGVGLVVASGKTTLTSPALPPTSQPLPPRRMVPGASVLLIGDSLANGLKLPMSAFAKASKISFAAHGVDGTRIADWVLLVNQDLAFAPTLVLVSLGTNDMKMTDPTVEKAQLDALVAKLLATGAEVIFVAPPTMPFPDRGVRAMLSALRPYPSDSLDIPRGPDGIHPTARGYAAWAAAIWQWLG